MSSGSTRLLLDFDIFSIAPITTGAPLSAYEGSPDDGASAFVMYLPIFKGAPAQGRFLGWAGARFRFKDIVQEQGQRLHPGLHLQQALLRLQQSRWHPRLHQQTSYPGKYAHHRLAALEFQGQWSAGEYR